MLKTDDGWWLVATSNDAPDAFPILYSSDLEQWEPKGFIFPAGQEPALDRDGPQHRRLLGAGNGQGRATNIGRSSPPGSAPMRWPSALPERPRRSALDRQRRAADDRQAGEHDGLGFDPSQPLMSGGVIDSHLFLDPRGERYLFWKDDTNSIWPRPLAMLLRQHPELIVELFAGEADRRSAAFAAAIVEWANVQRPMTRFFVMQPLIEAALNNWNKVRRSSPTSGSRPRRSWTR